MLADLGIVTKTEVEGIVKTCLTKCTSTLQSQIVKTVESTLEDPIQVSNFSSNNGLKTAMSNAIEQPLSRVVPSGRAPTTSEG